MDNYFTSCFKFTDALNCKFCNAKEIVKNGNTKNGKQQFKCKNCNKFFIINYSYNAYCNEINGLIIKLTKEGLGIRSTARVLKISTTTLLKRIVLIARNIRKPIITFLIVRFLS